MENKNQDIQNTVDQSPTGPETPIQSSKNHSKKSNIILVGIGALIILLIGIAGGFFLAKSSKNTTSQKLIQTTTPSATIAKDQTSNWNILTNSMGYSIKYPSNLKVISQDSGADTESINQSDSDFVVISTSPHDGIPTSPTMHIHIVKTNPFGLQDKTPQEIAQFDLQKAQSNANNKVSNITQPTPIIIDGEQAYTYSFNGDGYESLGTGSVFYKGPIKIIEGKHNDQLFSIIYTPNDTFNEILSTFKFTQ